MLLPPLAVSLGLPSSMSEDKPVGTREWIDTPSGNYKGFPQWNDGVLNGCN